MIIKIITKTFRELKNTYDNEIKFFYPSLTFLDWLKDIEEQYKASNITLIIQF